MPHSAVIAPGVVFWLLPTEEAPKPHPWVIISGIVDGTVITVNVTDACHYPSSTCHLNPGEHECITKPSVIYYPLYKERNAKSLGVALTRKTGLRIFEKVSPVVMARIIAGMKTCRDVRDSIKIKYGFLPPKQKTHHPF